MQPIKLTAHASRGRLIIERVYSVYILRCADGSLYTGFARDAEKRLAIHNAGRGAKYTASRLPVTLAYREPCSSLSGALRRECQIKTWSRAQKEALIAGDSALLKRS